MGSRNGLPQGRVVFLASFAAPVVLLAFVMLLVSGASHTPALAAPADSSPGRVDSPAPLFQSGPQADFSASPRVGAAPLRVQFSDRSTGTVESRLWTFGDGFTATTLSPVHNLYACRHLHRLPDGLGRRRL